MTDDFRSSPIIAELLKLPRRQWIEIQDLIDRIDPSDTHLEALIHEQVDKEHNVERCGTKVRLSMKIPKLHP